MSAGLRGAALALTVLAVFAGAMYAQGGADISKGGIVVDVIDPSGAVIQNATVIITGSAGEQRATTNLRGEAVFLNLIPGQYRVRVQQPGFRAYESSNIQVMASQRAPVRAQLEPGQVTETIQVTETAVTVDTTTTTTGSNLTQEVFTNLPVGRNVASLFSLAPGVAPSGDPVLGTSNPSISGSSGLENQYIIDGINTTDQGYGSFGVFSNIYGSLGTGVNFDFVREVQVKTGGFEAQYGQALGGIVNVVTASGGNELHGAVYGYSTPRWGSRTYLQPNTGFGKYGPRTATPQTEIHAQRAWDAGFNIGGPLIRDKFFWYGSFDPSFSFLTRMAPQGFAARNAGDVITETRSWNWVGKLNYNISDNHHLEGTAFGDPTRTPSGFHRSLVREELESIRSSLDYGTRNWAVKYNGLLGANTVLSGNFAWNHTSFTETPAVNAWSVRNYALPIPGVAQYTTQGGVGFMENNDGDNKQVAAMITRNATLLGGHQIDIGYQFNDVNYAAIRMYSGPNFPLPAAPGIAAGDVGKPVHGALWYFYPTRTGPQINPNLPATQTFNNVYRLVRGNFSDPSVATDTRYHSAFVQDAWSLSRFLTLKLGVRWEEQRLAGNFSRYTFAGNWAPRLGFIVDPTGSRKTKIFANWGRFFEKIPQDLAVRSMSKESAYFFWVQAPGQPSANSLPGLPPTAANVIPGTVVASGTSPTIIYGGTKSMYQDEVAGGIEHEFGRGFVVSSRFIYRDLKRGLEDISGVTAEQALAGSPQQYVISNPSAKLDIFNNPQACTIGTANCDPDTGFTFGSGDLGSDGLPDLFPDMRRVYKSWELQAEKRFGSNWSILANYRLAKLFGNYEGLFRNDNGQSDPNITSLFDFAFSPALADQFRVGVLPTDRRHIANFYGNYLLFNRVNIGAGWQVLSGTPITGLLAHPVYENAGEVPKGARGAFGRTPWQNYFDLRMDYQHPISERVRLKVGGNVFNLFNRRTVTAIDQNIETAPSVNNPDFLLPLRVHRPMYASFNARLEF